MATAVNLFVTSAAYLQAQSAPHLAAETGAITVPPSSPLNRRTFIVRGFQLSGLAIGGGTFLEACSSSSKSGSAASSVSAAASPTAAASASTATSAAASSAASSAVASAPASSAAASSAAAVADLGTLDFRLSWIKNVEFAGEYIADSKGYYKAEGFSSVNLQGGGPTATPIETDLVQNKTFCGISSPDITGAAVVQGAPLKIVAAQYQKNPFAIMSLAKNPIKTPQDMIGKKIGVQATNESVWDAFLKANNLDPSKITKVPVQFDPTPITTGTVDGWFSFITNEPITIAGKGFPVTTFLLADYNYPLVSEVYVVRTADITANRAKIKAMLLAEIKGWKDNIANPAEGAMLAVNTYGKGLGLTVAEQTLESAAEGKLIVSDDTAKNGLFTITPELLAANIKTLGIAGVNVTADQLFDLSIIDEIYKDDPSLI
jgi:ABC-type nitrate/sulfonate/bicarbonate transport system substrate-binding protein